MDLVSFETPIEFKMFEEVMIAGKFFNILLCTFLLDVLFIFELRKFLHNVERTCWKSQVKNISWSRFETVIGRGLKFFV